MSATAAVELLALAAGTELTVAFGFAAGVAAAPWALAGGLAAVAAIAARATREWGGRVAAGATAVALLAAIAGPAIARRVYDMSWDGQAYHQYGVVRLAEGWNPAAGPLPAAYGSNAFFVNHYAKGAWFRGAPVVLLLGDVEAAKAWTVPLAAAAALAASAALASIPALGVAWAAALAILCAASPVVTTQLLTSYVDGQLASVLTAWAALVVVAALRGSALPTVGVLACAALAPGIKFTGVVYAVLLGGLGAAAVWPVSHARARGLAIAAVAGLALALGAGSTTYVRNWRSQGHPFYPLAGPGAMDIIPGQVNGEFLARSRLGRLVVSTFAASQNDRDLPPVLKPPFTFVGDETTPFRWPDVRLGGFGPLFSGGLLLSAGAAVLGLLGRSRAAALSVGASLALLATALANPHCWWARYAPQLWLVPLGLALAGALSRRRLGGALAALALLVLAADAGIVAVNGFRRGWKRSEALRAQLADLAREPAPVAVRFGSFEVQRGRLSTAGVRFVEVKTLPCAAPELLESSPIEICRAGR